MQKVAIFGGTFDPVHWGHLLIAQTALQKVALDQVIWVPSRSVLHKQTASFEHRLQMVQEAIADNPAFAVSSSCRAAYAIQTLNELQALYPQTHWYWLVGLDAFQTLPRWYRRDELIKACDWLVAPRLAAAVDAHEQKIITPQRQCEQVVQKLAAENIVIDWQILPMPSIGVSSSLIRQSCRDRCSIRYLVPEAVRFYIATHNLYSSLPDP